MRVGTELKFENYESVQHRLQFSEIKKGAKISFHRHFNTLFNSLNIFTSFLLFIFIPFMYFELGVKESSKRGSRFITLIFILKRFKTMITT